MTKLLFRFVKRAASLAQKRCAASPTVVSHQTGNGYDGWKLKKRLGVPTKRRKQTLVNDSCDHRGKHRIPDFAFDILPALKGEDSHERRPAELGCLRFAHRRGAGHAKWPLLLSSNRTLPPFPAGYERLSADSEVLGCLASVPNLSRRGTFEHRSGSPILSDCPGMGADRPRRMDRDTHGEHLRLYHTVKVNKDGDSSPPLRARLSRLQLRKLNSVGLVEYYDKKQKIYPISEKGAAFLHGELSAEELEFGDK